MKPIILRQHEVIHLRDHGSVIAWRVVKPGSLLSESDGAKRRVLHLPHDVEVLKGFLSERQKDPLKRFCKYGQTGEERWVKETWQPVQLASEVSQWRYRATDERGLANWRSPATMPRWASRFTVTLDVGLKRIQEVTEEEAVESGVFWFREYCQRGCQDFDESMTDLQLFKVLTEWKNKGLNLDRNDYFWKITCTLKK